MDPPVPLAIPHLDTGASPPSSSPPSYGRRGANRGGLGGPRGSYNRTRVQLSPPSPNSCVVLKNLDYKITQDELVQVVREVTGDRKAFESVSLVSDKATGNFRGLAFVNFHTLEDAAIALDSLSKICINGRKVVAEYRRMRPGEREKREAAAERRRANHLPRATFEQNVTELDANGNQMDKRRAFFHTRDVVRKADEKCRAAEKADRDRERELSFRTRLMEYRDLLVDDPAQVDDLTLENDLTSYERRMVHVICDEIGLGHMSVLGEDGMRVLKVTKHPARMAEWAELTADIRAAANERKVSADAEEKRRRKEARRDAARLASSPNASSDWKKGGGENSLQSGPVTKEELEGIKWFKPRSAKAADGEELTAGNAIKLPQYKLYIPPRQPSGPDGTIGFHKRKPPASEGDDDDEAGCGSNDESSAADEASTQQSRDSTDSAGSDTRSDTRSPAEVKSEERAKPVAGSQTHLNPSVPAFTPSATYAT